MESKTIFLSDDIHHQRCVDNSEHENRCRQMKLQEISMWKERQGLWVSITDEDSMAVRQVRKTLPTETLPYLVESDPTHRQWSSSNVRTVEPHSITIVYTGNPHPANLVALR